MRRYEVYEFGALRSVRVYLRSPIRVRRLYIGMVWENNQGHWFHVHTDVPFRSYRLAARDLQFYWKRKRR